MKSHGPIFGWMEMLPSNHQHNLERERSIASYGTLGTLVHTHIYLLLPMCVKFHREENPCSPSHWTLAARTFQSEDSITSSEALLPNSSTESVARLSNPSPSTFSPHQLHTLRPPSLHSLVFNLSMTLNNNPIISLNSIQDVHLHPPF